jgi:hypothetical protein
LIFAALSPQSFAGGVVGTGTPDSCTEAALDDTARGGGLVTFNCGGPATITVTASRQINNDMTIDGGGVITISGGNSVGFVTLGKATLTLQNLTFVDLNGILDGTPVGALYNNSGTLSIINCTFSGNSAPIISNTAVTVTTVTTVTNSTFSDNSGGVIGNGGTLTVSNSTFSGNSGGVISNNNGTGGTFTITDSTFSGNSGGAISSYYGGTTGTITDSTFSGNSGGAIGNAGTLTVINSTFSGNTFTGYPHGAGAIGNSGTLTVINSTFSGNAGSGSFANSIQNSGTLTFTNTIVANTTNGANCFAQSGTIIDGGDNLDDGTSCGFNTLNGSLNNTNPLLDSAGLANNGGPTQTIALEADSPAIDAGDESVCAAPPVDNLDQRGYVRPGVGATNCSIGAYEYNAQPSSEPTATATETPVSTSSPTGTPTAAAVPTPTVAPCVGDCNGDGTVTVNEILTMVNIALGNAPVTACEAGDANHDGRITVDEILMAVNNALNGCRVS